MPKMNTPEVIKQIMSQAPVPIRVFTGADPTGPQKQECMAKKGLMRVKSLFRVRWRTFRFFCGQASKHSVA